MRSAALRAASSRLGVVRAFTLLCFLGLAVRAAHLSLAPLHPELGPSQTHTSLRLPPTRGLIVDRRGVELAISADGPSVYAARSEIEDVERSARLLSPVLKLSEARVSDRLRAGGSFVFLARWVSDRQAAEITSLQLPGIGIVREPRRAYPAHSLAAALIGFANIDGHGARGIEEAEDSWLRGKPLRIPVERDARGQMLMHSEDDTSANAGGDIALTLDAALQAEVEAALVRGITRSGAMGGFVTVMDPHTGDLLASAESPSFDPNHFRDVAYPETRSRVFLDALEPGSTLKAFLVAAALETGNLQADSSIDCEGGAFRVPGKTIRDTHPHDLLDLAGILRVSSNIGAVKIAQMLGAERHYQVLQRFGFGNKTGSDFPLESAGLMRNWRRWRALDHATIAFGQGIAVTPIQLATATAALANSGVLLRPRLVAARRRHGGTWQATPIKEAGRPVSPTTARQMLSLLEEVVSFEGTGRLAGLRGVRAAGKTGTAQKLDLETGRYSQDRFIAWFLGVAPAEAPRVVVVVGIDEPERPLHTGGAAAAPVFAQVAAAHLTRLGRATEAEVPPARPQLHTQRSELPDAPRQAPGTRESGDPLSPTLSPVTARGRQEDQWAGGRAIDPRGTDRQLVVGDDDSVFLPDFRGLTLPEVKEIVRESTLRIEIEGRGRAVAQDPHPGTVLAGPGKRVHIRFSVQAGEG